jgi:K+-sensing histidine kinase KdpD
VNGDVMGLRSTELWTARIRLGAVLFAAVQVGALRDDYPPGYALAAWVTVAALALGALAIWVAARRPLPRRRLERLGFAALAFDTAIVSSFVLIYSFQAGSPVRMLLFVPVIEAAMRYGLSGGVATPVVLVPVYATFEAMRARHFETDFVVDFVTFPIGVQLIAGLIVGWLVERLRGQTSVAEQRVAEAEQLRDELGRRVGILEAANRCARALTSSLDLDEVFAAFNRELEAAVPFDRVAIVLAEEGVATVIATAGRGADEVFPPGTARAIEGSVLAEVLEGSVVYREDMADARYPEEEQLLALGLRSRLAAPLVAGSDVVGMISVVRSEPRAFAPEDAELMSLLGRVAAAAVQNIRAYGAERTTVEELRRLSALRADFVSLVSHELRNPMAAVIGAARTLQHRGGLLSAEQRDGLLALVAAETERLSSLIGDVLDTSRIESGSFSYRFADVDVAALVREVVAAAELAQDGLRIATRVPGDLPAVRGDAQRLRQVLVNLIENAVKYSPAGSEVEVRAHAANGKVHVDVVDDGPGIAEEHQRLIFEKFGRVTAEGAKPGSGLGLFIARSIAEAHGGTLTVSSVPRSGSRFTLVLPVP